MSEASFYPAKPADSPEQTLRLKRAAVIYAMSILGYAALFAIWQVDPVPGDVYLFGILLWAVCVLPLAIWYARGQRVLPMFELVCLSYGLQFSMPVFLQPNVMTTIQGALPLRWSGIFETLLLTILGVGALLAGYYLGRRLGLVRALPQIDLPLRPERQAAYLALTLGLGSIVLYQQVSGYYTISNSVSGLISVLSTQFRAALVILAYQVYGGQRPRIKLTMLLYVFVAFSVAAGLLGGMLENALIPLVLLVIVQWHASGKAPARLILVGFVGFVIFNAVKFDYRQQVWNSADPVAPADRLALWVSLGQDLVTQTATGDVLTNIESTIRQSMARFDLIHKFVYVHEMTPRLIPYYEGQTYSYLLVAWIPRFFWPDKPDASASNNRIDVDYGLVDMWDPGTTVIAIGQLPEAFANFGIAGVAIVMFLQGLIFGALDHIFNGPRSDGGRALYVSIMVYLLNGIGTSTVIWFGALLQNLLANAFILRIFATSFRAQDPPAGEADSQSLSAVQTQ